LSTTADITRLTIQIVNFRTRVHLERCLGSIRDDLAGAGIEHRIEVLDNDSGDDLSDLPGRFDRLHVHRAPRNLGFGAGHNLLARRTRAGSLLILNPDVELIQRSTVARLLAAAAVPGVAAVGPRLVDLAGAPQRYDHGRLHGVRAWVARGAGNSYWRPSTRARDVAWVSGAALLVTRSAFDDLGGFDERLFLYKEEEDLCLRLRRQGARVRYEPSIVVRHEGSVVARREEHLAAAVAYFHAKHHPRRGRRRALEGLHRALERLP